MSRPGVGTVTFVLAILGGLLFGAMIAWYDDQKRKRR